MPSSSVGSRSGYGEPGSTSSALLERVKARRPEAWERLVDLYGPLVYGWCRASGVAVKDVADVVQEVFAAVAAHIGDFRRQGPSDSFRAWLRTIAQNKARDYFRRCHRQPAARGGTDAQEQLLNLCEPPEPTDQPAEGASLVHRAMELVRVEFENRTWEAFWRTTVNGESPADIAADLGVSTEAVYQAKSRVLRRLRRELESFGE